MSVIMELLLEIAMNVGWPRQPDPDTEVSAERSSERDSPAPSAVPVIDLM